MFAYDRNEPLAVRETAAESPGGTLLYDLTYASPTAGRVTAYLTLPAKRPPRAAVLFLHPGQRDRGAFLDEALTLSRRGAVCLSIDAPFTRPGRWRTEYKGPPHGLHDYGMFMQTVVDLRRGVDLLAGRLGHGPGRIAYVGHSFGATVGGLLAGVERRISAFVLMAGSPSLSQFWQRSRHPVAKRVRDQVSRAELTRYVAMTAPLDAVRHVGRSAAPLLFQFSRADEFVSAEMAAQYVAAAPELKELRWYAGGHMLDQAALVDRLDWLAERLGLG